MPIHLATAPIVTRHAQQLLAVTAASWRLRLRLRRRRSAVR
jgi:hypothetical protein